MEQLIGSPYPTIFIQGGFPNTNGNDALELVNNNGSYIYSEPEIFIEGATDNWPYVIVAAQQGDGNNGSEQTLIINVLELPAGGAEFRIAKTVANGNYYFGPPIPLTLGVNERTVSSVSFDRTVKFQFSSGDIKFDLVQINGNNIYDNVIEVYGVIGEDPDTEGAGCGSPDCWDTEGSWAWKDNSTGNTDSWIYADVNCTNGSTNTQTSSCPFPLAINLCSSTLICDSLITIYDTVINMVNDSVTITIYDTTAVQVFDTLLNTINDTVIIEICDSSIITIYDSSLVTVYDTITDVIYDTNIITVYDTLINSINDTITTIIYDTNFVTVLDSSFVTIFDTITTYIFDTIAVTDTLYIDLSFVSSTIINNSNILVYPNPSYDYVIIENEFYNLTSEYAIEIVNISGQVVCTSSLDSPILQISVADIGESGVHLIHIKDGSNIVLTKHLVILN